MTKQQHSGNAARHSRIYTVLLVMLAILGLLVAAVIILVLLPIVHQNGSSRLAYQIGIALYTATSTFLGITIACRQKKPSVGRILSKIANVLIMYPFFPIGVAVGIYGFWKVDRRANIQK
jgi:hypothetical protein